MTFQITTPTGGSDSLNFKNFSGTSIGSIAAADGANNALTVTTGSAGSTAVVFDNNQNTTVNYLSAQNTFGFKNRIINGGCVIDQRNSGASVTPTNNQYSVDRWQFQGSQASKLTMQQNAGSVTPPVGFVNYLGVTSSSAYSVASTDYFLVRQAIEGYNMADLGWGTASAKTVTLSFQVYSSLTGTFGGSLSNNGDTRCYPFTYSIPVANTWTTISITIAGDTSGTWQKTTSTGINIYFSMGTGSTYLGSAGAWAGTAYYGATGQTNLVGTNGATFYITGVQLEKGNIATPFDYRDYGRELQMCQRYYEQDAWSAVGVNTNGSNINWIMFYKVPKRATPTLSVSGTVTFQGIAAGISQGAASGNINWIVGGTSRSGSTYQAYYVTSDSGGWYSSAEL